MTTTDEDHKVLVVGRSRAVLDTTAVLLRDGGYAAETTNHFEAITARARRRSTTPPGRPSHSASTLASTSA